MLEMFLENTLSKKKELTSKRGNILAQLQASISKIFLETFAKP